MHQGTIGLTLGENAAKRILPVVQEFFEDYNTSQMLRIEQEDGSELVLIRDVLIGYNYVRQIFDE